MRNIFKQSLKKYWVWYFILETNLIKFQSFNTNYIDKMFSLHYNIHINFLYKLWCFPTLENLNKKNKTKFSLMLKTLIYSNSLPNAKSYLTSKLKEDTILRQFLIRWLEHWTGSASILIINKSPLTKIPTQDLINLKLLSSRVKQYAPHNRSSNLGIWSKSAEALFVSAKLQEPSLFLSWMQHRLKRMPLFSHRKFFRIIGLMLSTLTYGSKPALSGVSMYVVGKISVTGNAMSRAQFAKIGLGGNSNLKTQVAKSFTLVRTTTGCLGFSLCYFYLANIVILCS